MTREGCDSTRDLLPDLLSGGLEGDRLSAIRDHLESCGECRQELELIQAIRESREVEVPPDLEARIQARIRAELGGDRKVRELAPQERNSAGWVDRLGFGRGGFRAPAWALSAAAVLILALGIARIWNGSGPSPTLDPVVVASQEPLPEAWLWDDGIVAGAPVFDDLSEEDLEELLKEFGG
jgi:anti-sigma factor RsiW